MMYSIFFYLISVLPTLGFGGEKKKKKIHLCHNTISWQHLQQQTLEMYKNCVFILWMVQEVIRSLEDKIAWGGKED